MSDSTENTNGLDSYGVWVKRPPQDAADTEQENADTALPDFDDMFQNDSMATEPEVQDGFGSDADSDDTTLTDKELSDITGEMDGIAEESATNEPLIEESLPDFDAPSFDIPEESANAESTSEAFAEPSAVERSVPVENSVATDDSLPEGFDMGSLPDFDPSAFESAAAPSSGAEPETAEFSADDFMNSDSSDGEVSFDDFMSGDGEISLDDFFDDDASSGPKEDDVGNDDPLDINVSFNVPEDKTVPTEDVSDEQDDEQMEAEGEAEDMFDTATAQKAVAEPVLLDSETEEISLDDFGVDENSDDATAVAAGRAVNESADEDVDLSDFGIDSDAEETPVHQDVQKAKKNLVVDYDLAITEDDNITKAPAQDEQNASENRQTVPENATVVDNSVLDMIMKELSGLKDEINSLKTEFDGIRNGELPSPSFQQKTQEEAEQKTEEPVSAEADKSGFFDTDDDDETIALSTDELSNIMNTADFTETEVESTASSAESFETERSFEESAEIPTETATEPSAEETVFDTPTETSDDQFAFAEPDSSLTEEPQTEISEDFASNEPVTDEAVAETPSIDETALEEPAIFEEPIAESEPTIEESFEEPATEEAPLSFDEPATEEPTAEAENDALFDAADEATEPEATRAAMPVFQTEEEPDSGLSFNTDKPLEEPNLSEMDTATQEDFEIPSVDTIAADGTQAESPVQADDILVESSNTDLMNSVNDSTETDIPKADNAVADAYYEDIMQEDPTVSDAISTDDADYLNEEPAESAEEVATIADEPVSRELPQEEATVEPAAESPATEESFVAISEPETDNTGLPEDLKKDVKSVLLYMDQLLENLPEDKILEFAKSEQFTTYKKLFNELGLS